MKAKRWQNDAFGWKMRMTDFFKRLNPNVVFVTIIALLVVGTYAGWHTYQGTQQSSLKAACAKKGLWYLGRDSDYEDALDTFTKLCADAGGVQDAEAAIAAGNTYQQQKDQQPAPAARAN